MRILVTGGAGFIGSALIRHLVSAGHDVLNLDKLTYAGNLGSLATISNAPNYHFLKEDITDADSMQKAFMTFRPQWVMHLAAESHVDRSIDSAAEFIKTNLVGTFTLLEAARAYWNQSTPSEQAEFRFLHVSTDEVFGDLSATDAPFSEQTPYAPSSPYAATKAGSDHLVRAWHRTYGLPILLTNCSNNYGHYQFPEKLIPHIILNALAHKCIPVYGDGSQIRDWLHVDDHILALCRVAEHGVVGETYTIGGNSEKTNLDVVKEVCRILDGLVPLTPEAPIKHYQDLICFVKDRPGHDRRYAINPTKIKEQLGWEPAYTFAEGLMQTVTWYINNKEWWTQILSNEYRLNRIGVSNDQ